MDDRKICIIDGCYKPARPRAKLCGMHQSRKARGIPADAPARASRGEPGSFYESAMATETDECIFWPYNRDKDGYARFKGIHIEFGTQSLHRAICIQTNGPAPTHEHHAAHTCGKGHLGCINKAHVSWKTPAENCGDKVAHGTAQIGERNGTARLTEVQVLRIVSACRSGVSLADAGRAEGVSIGAIWSIVHGRTWSHLTGIALW